MAAPRVSPLRLLLACLGVGAVAALLVRAFGASAGSSRKDAATPALDGILQAREALRSATLQSDVERAASTYATDCIAVSADGTFHSGRAQIRDRMQRATRSGRFVAAAVHTQHLNRAGASAIETGSFSYTLAAGDRTMNDAGQFTALWTMREGRWTIAFESCRGA